jgi:hypothetical protein
MRMKNAVAVAALLIATAAAALPPPVPVNVVLFTPGEPPSTESSLRKVLDRLVADNWIALEQVQTAGADFASCATNRGNGPDPLCLATALRTSRKDTNSLVLMVYHPGWRGAQHSVVCVGAEPARSRVTTIFLTDALSPIDSIYSAELRKVASCLIGALHGPAERG